MEQRHGDESSHGLEPTGHQLAGRPLRTTTQAGVSPGPQVRERSGARAAIVFVSSLQPRSPRVCFLRCSAVSGDSVHGRGCPWTQGLARMCLGGLCMALAWAGTGKKWGTHSSRERVLCARPRLRYVRRLQPARAPAELPKRPGNMHTKVGSMVFGGSGLDAVPFLRAQCLWCEEHSRRCCRAVPCSGCRRRSRPASSQNTHATPMPVAAQRRHLCGV